MTVITHARRKSRLGGMIDAAGGISVLRALTNAGANLNLIKPPCLQEARRLAEALGAVSPQPDRPHEALPQLYRTATSIIDAVGPFDMNDVCAAMRDLCDLIDQSSSDRPFDWRVAAVYSRSVRRMIDLPTGDPARLALASHLGELGQAKRA